MFFFHIQNLKCGLFQFGSTFLCCLYFFFIALMLKAKFCILKYFYIHFSVRCHLAHKTRQTKPGFLSLILLQIYSKLGHKVLFYVNVVLKSLLGCQFIGMLLGSSWRAGKSLHFVCVSVFVNPPTPSLYQTVMGPGLFGLFG